ncbi:MAG: lipopolysaccharide biosynthesis protein [Candidatus Acidiferrales bacterium]
MIPPSQAGSLIEPPAAGASDHHEALLSRVLQSSFWILNSNLFSRALSLARGIVLARLLVPDDFGLFGLATVVIGFTAMFSDVGAGVFLVYSQDRVEEHVDTAFWANLGIASLLAGGVLAVAPLVARIYHRRELIPILAVLAVALWVQTATTVHRNLVRRSLRFRALAIVDAVFSLATFVVAVALAWRGYGVWSFVLATLAGNIVIGFLLFYVYAWVPRWRFSKISLRALAPFSGWYVGQAIAWYLVFNVDNLMVGKYLGIAALGIYGLAYNYSLLPISFIGVSLGNVVFAELPRLYSDLPRFWSAFFMSSKLMAILVCPLAAALVIGAPDVFPLLFGPKWVSAIVPFQILAVYGAVRGLWIDPFGALGKFRPSCFLATGTLVLSGLGIYVALPYGTNGVAVAVLITVGASHIAALYIASGSFRTLFRGFRNAAPYVLTAVAGGFLAELVRRGFAFEVSSRRELLALVSLTTLFGIYGAVFYREIRSYFSAWMTKRIVTAGEGA